MTSVSQFLRSALCSFEIEATRIVFSSEADIFATGPDVTMDPAASLATQRLRQIKTGYTPAARLVAQLAEYEVKYHGCCSMHDPLTLAVLPDASLLDFTLAGRAIVEGNGWARGVTRVLPFDSSGPVHVASAMDGPRFLKLFLARILEE